MNIIRNRNYMNEEAFLILLSFFINQCCLSIDCTWMSGWLTNTLQKVKLDFHMSTAQDVHGWPWCSGTYVIDSSFPVTLSMSCLLVKRSENQSRSEDCSIKIDICNMELGIYIQFIARLNFIINTGRKENFFFLGVFLYKKKEFLLWNGIIILTFVCLRKPRVPWFQPMQLGLFLLFHFKTG